MRIWVVGIGLGLLQVVALYLFGQPFMCECGHVSLWSGNVLSSENSQQLADWYSFSHIIHGFIFYYLAKLLFPRTSWQTRLLIAIGVEVSWEVLENTPMLIEHYRQQALAQGYVGDSILNSASDTLMMIGGFLLARKLPVWAILAFAIGMEVFVGYFIHDNLTLNVINLIYPLEFLHTWQAGG